MTPNISKQSWSPWSKPNPGNIFWITDFRSLNNPCLARKDYYVTFQPGYACNWWDQSQVCWTDLDVLVRPSSWLVLVENFGASIFYSWSNIWFIYVLICEWLWSWWLSSKPSDILILCFCIYFLVEYVRTNRIKYFRYFFIIGDFYVSFQDQKSSFGLLICYNCIVTVK